MVDEITMAINSERNSSAHDLFYSIMNRICQTEVEINLNNNLVNETNTGHEVDENLQGVVMNEEITDNNLEKKISDNALLVKWIISRRHKIGQTEVEIDLNNNLVTETETGHRVNANLEGVAMNEGLQGIS